MKNLRYMSRSEFNSEYQLWVSIRWRHCDIHYKHYISTVLCQKAPSNIF